MEVESSSNADFVTCNGNWVLLHCDFTYEALDFILKFISSCLGYVVVLLDLRPEYSKYAKYNTSSRFKS